jgi:hypothetical protein
MSLDSGPIGDPPLGMGRKRPGLSLSKVVVIVVVVLVIVADMLFP